MSGFRLALVALVVGLFSGCTATSTISSPQAGALIDIKESHQSAAPRTESFGTTSFGNYEFRAQAAGLDPFFGVLPLRFNDGHLVMDILFFAPATFFNLRGVFGFYEFDIENRVLKYRQKTTDAWTSYTPRDSEVARAKAFFKEPTAAAVPAQAQASADTE